MTFKLTAYPVERINEPIVRAAAIKLSRAAARFMSAARLTAAL